MEFLKVFLGRFHPLFVHFPIGILVLAFIFEALSPWKYFEKLKSSVQPMLVVGAGFALISAITGYLLSLEGGYPDRLLSLHQNLGIATAVSSFIVCAVRNRIFRQNKVYQTRAQIAMLLVVVFLLSWAGHVGGSLTHGEEYLTEAFSLKPEGEEAKVKLVIREDVENVVLYTDVVQPVLDAKCYSCHSSKKQKGQLRLDGIEFVKQGGKHGAVLKPGVADSSSLYHRLILPIEEEEHMPPREKTQLTSAEIDVIKLWVGEGYSFDKTVAHYTDAPKLKSLIAALQAESVEKENWIPKEAVAAPNEKAVRKLQQAGVLVTPVAKDNNYLMLNFVNATPFPDSLSSYLQPLKDNIVWLNFGNTAVTDNDLKAVTQLSTLRYLYLHNTKVSDAGLAAISGLKHLVFLNVVGTPITDQAAAELAKLTALKELYAYKTKLSSNGYVTIHKQNAKLILDSGGYVLPVLSSDTMVYTRQ